MSYDIAGAAVAAVAGLLIAFVNYIVSKNVILKKPEKYSFITVARQVLQVGFLVVVYFIGTEIQIVDLTYLLIGAVLGMTLPMFFFTKKLLEVNEKSAVSLNKNKQEDETDG